MTTKAADPAAVAKEIILNNITNIRRPHTEPVTVKFCDEIKQALLAHGEAEYRRGLEDAAKVCDEWQSSSTDLALRIRARSRGSDNA